MRLPLAIKTVFLVFATTNCFADTLPSSPEGMHRSYAQNYKDLVLANCIANAYAYDVKVGIDAGSSATAMEDWANYDWEEGPDEIRALVKKIPRARLHKPVGRIPDQGYKIRPAEMPGHVSQQGARRVDEEGRDPPESDLHAEYQKALTTPFMQQACPANAAQAIFITSTLLRTLSIGRRHIMLIQCNPIAF